MFSEDHKDTVAFRNGDFISPEFSMVKGIYYDNETGEELEATEELEKVKENVQYELELSDKVLHGDLLRFYTPTDDWEAVNSKDRSEERRVGKECRSRWSTEQEKQKR